MEDAAYRALVFDASKGLDALNTYIETRFELADAMEDEGHPHAQLVRETWQRAWDILNGDARRSLAQELHDIMMPPVHDEHPILLPAR